MKELWPIPSRKEELQNDKQSELIETLSNTVNQLIERVEADEISLEDLKVEIATALQTIRIEAEQGKIDSLAVVDSTITNILSTDIDTSNLKSETANIVQAAITTLSASIVNSDNIQSSKAKIDEIEAKTIVAEKAEIDEYEIENATIGHSTITDLDSDTIDTNTIESRIATIGVGNIDTIESDSIATNELNATLAEIAEIQSNKIESEYILHNTEYTSIGPQEKAIIELPIFLNGCYRFVIFDNSEFFFSAEVFNGANNYFVRFNNSSTNPNMPLRNVGFYNTKNDIVQVYFDLETFNKKLDIYYMSDSFSTIDPPNIYTEWPIDTTSSDFRGYDSVVYKQAGNLFNRPIIFDNEASTSGSLLITPTNWEESTDTQKVYDTSANVDLNVYRPDQSLNTDDDVSHKNLTIDEHTTTNTLTTNNTTKLNRHIYVGSLSNLASFDLGENSVGVIYE